MDPQAMPQEVRSTVIQEPQFGTAGDNYFCCVSGLSDKSQHPQPVCWAAQRVEQTFPVPIIKECYLSM